MCLAFFTIREKRKHDVVYDYKEILYFRTKCKGVLAAVMAIKHLMKKPESSNTAYNLFSMYHEAFKYVTCIEIS